MNIYVGNLSYDVSAENLRQAFESFGQVTSVRIVKDKYSGQPRGFGFVEMLEQAQAQEAIKSLNGKELMGKQMSVNEARPRTDRGRSGGRGEGEWIIVAAGTVIDPVFAEKRLTNVAAKKAWECLWPYLIGEVRVVTRKNYLNNVECLKIHLLGHYHLSSIRGEHTI